jgi:hypothetical protein
LTGAHVKDRTRGSCRTAGPDVQYGRAIRCAAGHDPANHSGRQGRLRLQPEEQDGGGGADPVSDRFGNVPLPDADEDEPRVLSLPTGEVRCRERLGGLLKHCYRAAA